MFILLRVFLIITTESFSLTQYLFYLSLNFHCWRHMGHNCWFNWEFIHLTMQCMWKQWVHAPQTSGQSSPGNEQSGQQDSKAIRQIPQLSSFVVHFQIATPVQPAMRRIFWELVLGVRFGIERWSFWGDRDETSSLKDLKTPLKICTWNRVVSL